MKLNEMDRLERERIGCHIDGRMRRCMICGALTPYVEICSEAHFCSTECLDTFYSEMNKQGGEIFDNT